jgi:flagellar FliJ protein
MAMVKKNFRLEQVLSYRKEVEKMRTMELVTARQEFEGVCEQIKQEKRKVDHLNTECLDRQRQGISIMDLQLYADFFQRKSADIRQQKLEADNLNRRVAEKQTILVEAALDKKVLETLKEKKALAHNCKMSEKERGFLEELALQKKGHR